MKSARYAQVLVLGLLLWGGPAWAQRITSPYRFLDEKQALSAFGGYIATGKGAVGLAPEGGVAGGARYSIRLSGPFAIEVEAGYFPGQRAVLDTVVVDSAFQQVGTADLGLGLALGMLRFNVTGPRTWHGLQPFVGLGVGAAIELSSDAEENEQLQPDARFEFGTTFAGHLGGGIEWFPSRRLAIRIDARNLLWNLDTPPAFLRTEIGLDKPQDEWVQNFMLTGGLSFHF